MKRRLLACLILLPCLSFAGSPPQPPTSDELDADQLNQIAADLAVEVSPGYRELKRDIYVYNYEHSEVFLQEERKSPVPPDSASGIEGVKRQVLWTYRRDKAWSHDVIGTGLYVAPDPIMSQSYGNALAEIKLPAKIRYMQANKIDFSPEFQTKLAAAGCGESNLVGMLFVQNNSACHIIALRMLEILHISAVQYTWDQTPAPYPGCDPRSSTSFILINPALAHTDYVHIFKKGESPEDSATPDRARIQALTNIPGHEGIFPDTPPTTIDMKAWTKEHILGCDGKKYPEDTILDSVMKTFPKEKPKLPALDFKTYEPTWDTPEPPLTIAEPCQNPDASAALKKIQDEFLAIAPALDRAL
jgi:hypothetical protein